MFGEPPEYVNAAPWWTTGGATGTVCCWNSEVFTIKSNFFLLGVRVFFLCDFRSKLKNKVQKQVQIIKKTHSQTPPLLPEAPPPPPSPPRTRRRRPAICTESSFTSARKQTHSNRISARDWSSNLHDVHHGPAGLVLIPCHDHALACRQSARLHHQRREVGPGEPPKKTPSVTLNDVYKPRPTAAAY